MLQLAVNTKKTMIIEPDVDHQPPSKKRKISSENELAEALLELRKQSIPRGRGPLVHPSTFAPFATRTPRKIRPRVVTSDACATISDDEDEDSTVLNSVVYGKEPSDQSNTKKFEQMLSFPLMQPSLPPGRPLAAAPRFPRFAPGAKSGDSSR